jgi:hypothetical protein
MMVIISYRECILLSLFAIFSYVTSNKSSKKSRDKEVMMLAEMREKAIMDEQSRLNGTRKEGIFFKFYVNSKKFNLDYQFRNKESMF